MVMAIVTGTLFATSATATLITDPVEHLGGWTTIVNGGFAADKLGLTPVEGSWFFNYNTTATTGRNAGAWKLFDATFVEEELKVTYSIGDFDSPYSLIGSFAVMLFADTNNDGQYIYSERIAPTTQVSRTVPVDGWERWEDHYEITASTTTAVGDLVIGKKIGFFIYGTAYENRCMAFDSLTIETIPEPVTIGLMGASLLVLVGFRRLRSGI